MSSRRPWPTRPIGEPYPRPANHEGAQPERVVMIQEIRELYAYNRWANHRVLDAVAALDPASFTRDLGSSFPSVQATLAHILGAEWIWLSRWRGTSPTGIPASWDLSTLDALRARWVHVEREQAAYVAGLTDADLDRAIDYRDLKGNPFTNTLGQMLRHVVNHSTYHRGQVATMLRQLGAEAVSVDLIRYYREVAAGTIRAGG